MKGRNTGRNLRGKGAGATRVVKEGENINRQRGGRGTGGLSIGSLLSRGATKKQLNRLDIDAAKCTDSPNLLPPDISFFHNKLDDIEYLLNDLSTVGLGVLSDQHLEVEVRLLHETDSGNLGRFTRVLQWLQSFEIFKNVQPLNFEEKTYIVPPSAFREGYTSNLIIRTNKATSNQDSSRMTERYLKVKKLYNQKLFIPLPSAQVCPRLGISLEAANFTFDTSNQDEAKTYRQRWTFPIDSNTLREFEGLPQIKTDIARGFIDLTITELANQTLLYAIEIEIDPSTIKALATERQVSIFGGREITSTSRDVKYLTLTDAQLQLLDSWTKILITVITKTAVFMTTMERQSIEEGFNQALGITTLRTIPSEIVNQPTDLHKRDLSWLSPDKSTMFMHLANYDQADEVNLSFLEKQGLFKPLFSIPGGYYASLKADGTRYYLYLATTGLYLVNPLSNTLTKISGAKTTAPFVKNILPGTILDTEVIGEILPDGTLEYYQFLIFDILALEGVDVRSRTYTDRLRLIESTVIKLNDLEFIAKIQRENQSQAAAAENYIAPVDPKGFQELFNLQAKPVYRLPSLEEIPSTDPLTGKELSPTDKILYGRQLAQEFFKIIGAVALEAYYSSTNLTESRPQDTKGIIWYTDGIILTPAERSYLEVDPKRNSRYSLVKKWKPVMTIDFRVRRDDTGRLRLFSGVANQGEVPFTGGRYPWNGQALLTDDMEGKIIEFQWLNPSKEDEEEGTGGRFVAVRERPDKLTPNNVKTSTDVWTLINDPITLEDLQGKTMTLMGRYHNRVKTYALADLATGIGGTNKILLDLGSGRGGDISKWHRFKRVYAVEPDIENLREFIARQQYRDPPVISNNHYDRVKAFYGRSRVITNQNLKTASSTVQPKTQAAGSIATDVLNSMSKRILKAPSQETQASKYSRSREVEDRESKIVTINLPAEDVQGLLTKIPLDKVDAVTMFNALTFFYQDLDTLLSLITTIKTFLKFGGYFYVLAMDGQLLLNSMGEHNTITTANIEISKSPDSTCRKIWIKSKVGIVRGQYEYLIHLDEFVQIMTEQGFKLLDERYLDEELLLTDEEYWFSSMFKLLKFAYGTSSVDNKSKSNEINTTKSKLIVDTRKENLVEILRPLIEKMESGNVIQPLEPYEAPQVIRSTVLASTGITALLRYGNPQDASAYLHAILRAFSKPYNALNLAEKQGFIIQLRKELADKYTREIHDKIISKLDGNQTTTNSLTIPALQYENLKAAIRDASFWITQHMLEFINDQLQVNVWFLRGLDAIPYQFEALKNQNRNNGRKNLILYWVNDNHFETVGHLEANNFVRLVFAPNDPLLAAFQ